MTHAKFKVGPSCDVYKPGGKCMQGELTGLELRRAACEALGYQVGDDVFGTSAPHIESDPAVSEPMTDEFCKRRGYEFTVSSFTDGIYNCAFFRMVGGIADRITSCDGSTPSEARARAIVMTARGRTKFPA